MKETSSSGQIIDGNIIVDDISALNMYLTDTSEFTGAINSDAQHGDVYVEIEEGSKWTLTADSYVSGLTVSAGGGIDLNGHKLYVDGKEYTEGTASEGTAFDITAGVSDSSGAPEGMPGDGQTPPDGGKGGPGGNPPDGKKPAGDPPEKPAGDNGSKPPEKPDATSGNV